MTLERLPRNPPSTILPEGMLAKRWRFILEVLVQNVKLGHNKNNFLNNKKLKSNKFRRNNLMKKMKSMDKLADGDTKRTDLTYLMALRKVTSHSFSMKAKSLINWIFLKNGTSKNKTWKRGRYVRRCMMSRITVILVAGDSRKIGHTSLMGSKKEISQGYLMRAKS